MFFVISFSLRLNKEIRRWRKKDVVDVACVNCTIRGHDHWLRVWKIWIFRYKNVSKNTTTGHLMCLKNGPYNIASLGWLNVQFHMIGATFFSIQELRSHNISLLWLSWHKRLWTYHLCDIISNENFWSPLE